jgi:putative transposase
MTQSTRLEPGVSPAGFSISSCMTEPEESPNLNAHAERVIQSIKHECLDHFLVFGRRHLDHLLGEYEAHYNQERPHQGVGNLPLNVISLPARGQPDPGRVECESRLGGLLRHYRREAA